MEMTVMTNIQNPVAKFFFQKIYKILGKTLISLQSRDGNLDEFFTSEIPSYATSLFDFEKLHLPAKQGRIHGCPSRVRVGRSSAVEGH